MKKNNEREIALNILMDIFSEQGYNNIVLRNTLKKHEDLTKEEKSFITQIVNGTLRNLILIDYIIDKFSKTKTKKMKPLILNIIRISVYQMKFMDKVPVSAICNEAVKITKIRGFHGLSGFVNGVLRNISRNLDTIAYPDKNKEKLNYLSVLYSYPVWLLEYYLESYSYDTILKMCKENVKAPILSIILNPLKTDKVNLKKEFLSENIEIMEEFEDGFLIKNTSNIARLNSFKEGKFHVMDKNASYAITLLDPKENEKILDMCSAPGGKSFVAAYKMKNKGEIISADIFEHKLELINNMKDKLGINIIKTELLDGCVYNSDFEKKFDKVVADVPCSGFGLLKKKPDIKYSKTYDDIKSLVSIQRDILKQGSKYVKVGGELLYSTCTISPLENMGNINWFLKNFDFEIIENKIVEFIPGINTSSDGFFVCVLRRRS